MKIIDKNRVGMIKKRNLRTKEALTNFIRNIGLCFLT